ncbi:hypothetical protein ACNI3T_05370 [Christiangramia sp. ASW11-125]|uniref:hypothetical protein n=1 Tax=Christiangramia sp. ASW11-125 TaxID=3400701 RepID=UPI003AAB15E3
MEIKDLSSEQLNSKIVTFEDRIKTMREYISDEDDDYTRSNMQTQLYRYNLTLNALKEEYRLRSEYGDQKSEIDDLFEKLKKEMLDKLNTRIPYQAKIYRTINSKISIDRLLSELAINSRHYNSFGFMKKEFLSQFPDELLAKRNFFLGATDIVQKGGLSIFIDSKSKHYGASESYHYGDCLSEHFDNAESYHHHTSTSSHWNQTKSVHFDDSKSTHFDDSEPQQYGNAICTRA